MSPLALSRQDILQGYGCGCNYSAVQTGTAMTVKGMGLAGAIPPALSFEDRLLRKGCASGMKFLTCSRPDPGSSRPARIRHKAHSQRLSDRRGSFKSI
jgi:hypothetical protein